MAVDRDACAKTNANMAIHDVLTLYHGSPTRVPRPRHGLGNPYNDYGLGFYCTREVDLAREWACPLRRDGFVNEYRLDMRGLVLLDLETGPYGILDWLCLLVENRRFECGTPLMSQAKEFLVRTHAVDTTGADVIRGYRADDSYFSFARAFLDNRISVRQLEKAMRLGSLGVQYMLRSPEAFERIEFAGAEPVDGEIWGRRREERDVQAREAYRALARTETFGLDDVFILDLMRAEG